MSNICRLKRKQKVFAWLLLSLVLFFLLASCAAFVRAETTYNMSETELTRLQQIYNKLEVLNNQLLLELNSSKKSLTELQNELNSYKAELMDLSQQLEQSKAESTELLMELTKANVSLSKAQASFKLYEIEVNKKIKGLVRQRNITAVVAILTLIFK